MGTHSKSILAALAVVCAATGALTAGGCGSTRAVAPESNTFGRAGFVTVWSDSVKDKGGTFDVRLKFQNHTDKTLLVLSREVKAWRGTTPGRVGRIDHAWDLPPRSVKEIRIVCDLGKGVTASGDMKIVVEKFHDNPSGDRRTQGTEIYDGVEWTLPESAAR